MSGDTEVNEFSMLSTYMCPYNYTSGLGAHVRCQHGANVYLACVQNLV